MENSNKYVAPISSFHLLTHSIYLIFLIIVNLALILVLGIGGIAQKSFGLLFLFILLEGIAYYYLSRALRLPIKTSISGSILTTNGLVRSKSVDLNQVSSVRGVVIVPGYGRGGTFTKGLKLVSPSGSVTIQLSSIANEQRKVIWDAVSPCVERARQNNAFSQDLTFDTSFSKDKNDPWRTFQLWKPQ
jgi:hypothetical protein